MRPRLLWLILCLSSVAVAAPLVSQESVGDDLIQTALTSQQYDLEADGLKFLLNEARNNDFFLLGELHGDNEIPALLRVLWPVMWKQGYRHIAAEVSPWAAYQLKFVPAGKGPTVAGLWTKQEASDVRALANSNANVIWGCDIEEAQPQMLIAELASLNPGDLDLNLMVELTKGGYKRIMAPTLLDLAKRSKGREDAVLNDVSLRENLIETLEVETNRLGLDTKMIAQSERERLMKEQFLKHFHRDAAAGSPSKVLLRFGRNHLHRGYDARGISTLGNFVAEFALSEGKTTFNVGAFGAGGKATLLGETWNADERKDELAFALLAEEAKYSATVFDLRALRTKLHQIPLEKRSALQTNLTYWADSYDALICYKTVTPLVSSAGSSAVN
jgi:hypothetical protein